jgi:trk system potassium uptake protein TrkA
VIVPQGDDPLEAGDELLFVAAAEVEPDVRTALDSRQS